MNMNARIDVWEANAYTQQSVDNPSDEQALNLLARLDGKRSTIFDTKPSAFPTHCRGVLR